MHPQLSFDQAPPIDVPFRFFLTAPLFGIAAGVLLLLEGGTMIATRWSSATLAGVHLLVAGYLLFAMCGALLQFVPVAAGGNVWRPRWVATWVHPLLILAVILLVAAFMVRLPGLFIAAAAGFSLALGVFSLIVGWALWRTPARGPTIVALRLALFGLLATLALGVALALGLAGRLALPLLPLTDVHAAWGLGGWALSLLAGVSYLVVPMFQLTPSYPAWLARGLPPALFALLLLWSLQYETADSPASQLVLIVGLGIGAAFAAVTLHLQGRRRRKVSDLTLLFFRTAMLALLAVFFSFVVFAWLPELRLDPRTAVWSGMLVIVGVFISAVNGMLYKIVPFLNWLHLQNLYGLKAVPPTMHQMIPEAAMRRQFRLHLAALALLLGAVWWPALARPAGLLFALSCAWLGWNLISAGRVYRDFKSRIPADAGELRS
jgi:hypothetical protein